MSRSPRHPQIADLEDVAKPLGGDEPGPRALVLEDRVRRDRRAVADLLDHAAGQAGLDEQLAQACDDGLRIVADAGGDLLGVQRAVGTQQHDVGEGAADIDTHPVTFAHSAARTAD